MTLTLDKPLLPILMLTFFRYTPGELRQFPLNSVSKKTITDNRPNQKDKGTEDKVNTCFFHFHSWREEILKFTDKIFCRNWEWPCLCSHSI